MFFVGLFIGRAIGVAFMAALILAREWESGKE